MALSQDHINFSIGNIEMLHGRFANELCNILKRFTGDRTLLDDLIATNNIIGRIIEILYAYDPVGISEINDANNGLTEAEIQSLISYSYRVLNKYGSEIFNATNPNIYL